MYSTAPVITAAPPATTSTVEIVAEDRASSTCLCLHQPAGAQVSIEPPHVSFASCTDPGAETEHATRDRGHRPDARDRGAQQVAVAPPVLDRAGRRDRLCRARVRRGERERGNLDHERLALGRHLVARPVRVADGARGDAQRAGIDRHGDLDADVDRLAIDGDDQARRRGDDPDRVPRQPCLELLRPGTRVGAQLRGRRGGG